MTKTGHVIFWVSAALICGLVVVISLVLADLDGLGRDMIEGYGSAATGAEVTADDVDLSWPSQIATVHGLRVGNPKGFGTDYSFRFDLVEVAINTAMSTDDLVVIKRLFFDGARVISECGEDIGSNLNVMFSNVARYTRSTSSSQSEPLPFRFVIEEFKLTNGQLRVMDQEAGLDESAPIPGFTLTGIGSRNGGATIDEIKTQLFQQLLRATTFASLCPVDNSGRHISRNH
jgi:hypothetical protein